MEINGEEYVLKLLNHMCVIRLFGFLLLGLSQSDHFNQHR